MGIMPQFQVGQREPRSERGRDGGLTESYGGRKPPERGIPVSSPIPPDKKIDPVRLDAWIKMNTVTTGNPSPGAPFIYIDDLIMGFKGNRLEPDEPEVTSPADVPSLDREPYSSEPTSDDALSEEWLTTLDDEQHLSAGGQPVKLPVQLPMRKARGFNQPSEH